VFDRFAAVSASIGQREPLIDLVVSAGGSGVLQHARPSRNFVRTAATLHKPIRPKTMKKKRTTGAISRTKPISTRAIAADIFESRFIKSLRFYSRRPTVRNPWSSSVARPSSTQR
jgi:hypothetical protein